MNINNVEKIREDEQSKARDDNFVSEVNHSIYYTRWFLRFIGIWQFVIDKPTKIDKIVLSFVLPFSSFSMIILVIPIFTCGFVNRHEDFDLLGLFDPIIFQTANILKHLVLIIRSRKIKQCITHMGDDWRMIGENDKNRDIMKKNLRVANFLTIICTSFMYTGAFLYNMVMPICSDSTINELNETIRPLAYPGSDYFIDVNSGFNYEIVFFSNCVSGFFHFSVVTAIFNLAAVLVSHACGQIQIVISGLEGLVGESADDDTIDCNVVNDRIASIIRCHVRVLRFSSRIDEVLREICLLEILASTLILCLLAYHFLKNWDKSEMVAILTYIVLLFSQCFDIYIICYIGELLKDQFSEVGKAAYLTEWYRLPDKTGLGLIPIIAISHYPRKLTAGGMMELSIASFGSIIRTSVAYLNMIRTVAN